MKKGILGTLIVGLMVLTASTAMAAPSQQGLANRSAVANRVHEQRQQVRAQRIAIPDGQLETQRIAIPDGQLESSSAAAPQRIAIPDGQI